MFSFIAFYYRIDVIVNSSVLLLGWVGLLFPKVNTLNNHSISRAIAVKIDYLSAC